MLLRDSGDLQIAPATTIDFDIIFTPTDVGFVRPTLMVESAKHGGDERKPVDGRFGPILNVTKGQGTLTQGEGIESLLGRERNAGQAQASLGSRKAANVLLNDR